MSVLPVAGAPASQKVEMPCSCPKSVSRKFAVQTRAALIQQRKAIQLQIQALQEQVRAIGMQIAALEAEHNIGERHTVPAMGQGNV